MADSDAYSSLPLEQRLTHKIWKVRVAAYNELTNELKELDPDTDSAKFQTYESFLPKMILDTNMAAQEAGVKTALAFVDNAPNATRRRDEIVAGVVAKCLASTKAGTRTQSLELLLLLSEVDTPAPVVDRIAEDGFVAKQPKALSAAVSAVREIIHAFGVKFINLKPLLKALNKPFSHKDNAVRAEAQKLALELYRWLGQALMPSLQDLPPVLLKELETQFVTVAGEPRPTQERLLRSQQEAEPALDLAGDSNDTADAGAGSNATAGGAPDAEIDSWDLADPVDISKKLPEDFYSLIKSKKWKERKAVVDELFTTLKASIRLTSSSASSDIIQEIGSRINDVNIIVATLAIQCLTKFASGLRTAFAPHAQSTLPALVEKLKERKQSVIDAIRETMDCYFSSALKYEMTTIADHYFTAATHKNPQVRAESARFLRRCFAVVPKRPSKADIKKYSDQLKVGLDDGDAGVRDASAECLGTLMKLVTQKVLEPFIESVDKIKKAKIEEYSQSAEVKANSSTAVSSKKAPPPAWPKPSAVAPSAAQQDSGTDDKKPAGLGANMPPHLRRKLEASARAAALKKAQREGKTLDDLPKEPEASPAPAPKPAPKPMSKPSAVPAKRPAAPLAKKPSMAKKPSATPKANGGGASASTIVKMRFANDESLDDKIAEALPSEVLEKLQSAKWKDRVEAMDNLKEYLGDKAASSEGIHPELVVRQFARRPGSKESNFQVTQRVFKTIDWMAQEESLDFNTGAAAICVPSLVDKLGDIKLKQPAGEALVSIAERHTLKFLFSLIVDPIRNQKSPKVIADCLAWIETQLLEFGIKGLALRPVVELTRDVGLTSSNAQTRAKAVSLMGTLRRAIGPAVSDLVGEINPQLMQIIEAEFDRVGNDPFPDPVRVQRGLEAEPSGGPGSGDGGAKNDDPMDELFPRKDIATLVGNSVYRKLNDNGWKVRKEALEEIQAALESAKHRIQPNIPADLYTALKLRLQDPNKNLITLTLHILAALSADSGAALTHNVRIAALATIHCLADKKPQLRAAAIDVLNAWASATPQCVDHAIIPVVHTALADTSPELRSSLLKWIADTLAPRPKDTLPELASLVSVLFSCMQDRMAEVRKQCQRVLALTIDRCGFEFVLDACNNQLTGAARSSVLPYIEEFRNTVGNAITQPAASANMQHPQKTRPGALAAAARSSATRTPSPAAEPVMTASELVGRASGSSAAPATAHSQPGVLRRPMAVRRPVGAAGVGRSRTMRVPGSGAGSSGVSSSSTSRPGSSMRLMANANAEELENMPPILNSDPKPHDMRARREMSTSTFGSLSSKWAQLADMRVRADLEGQLNEQMMAHFNPLIHKLLFSTGHHKDRDWLSGLSALDEVLSIPVLSYERYRIPLYSSEGDPSGESLAARYIANIDLLLKYISIKLFDGSTHTLLKCFDLLEQLIRMTETLNTSWTDYDVQSILPALITRLGDSKEAVRVRARNLLVQSFIHLYSTTKLFSVLLDLGVGNHTNARVRQEALDSMSYLVRNRTAGLGITAVCANPTKAVPIIAQGISDRDSNVRSSSLNMLVAIGEQLPGGADELWRLCGRLPERERTMLEEKLKRSSIGMGSGGASSGGESGIQRPGSRASGIGGGLAGISARPRPGSGANRPTSMIGVPGGGSGVLRGSRIGRPLGAGMQEGGGGSSTSLSSNNAKYRQSLRSRPQSVIATSGSGLSAAGRPTPQQSLAPGVSSSGASSSGIGRPMFSLDFDHLSLPSYSASTTEQFSSRKVAPTSKPLQQQQYDEMDQDLQQQQQQQQQSHSSPQSRVQSMPPLHPTHMPQRKERIRSALAGLQLAGNRNDTLSSPVSRSQPPHAFDDESEPLEFVSMSEHEQAQVMQGILADLSGDDSRMAAMAIDRLQEIVDTIERPTQAILANFSPEADSSVGAAGGPALWHTRKNISDLISAISMQIRWAFTTMTTDPSSPSPFQIVLGRLRKNTIGLLIDIFSDLRISLWVPRGAMQTLIEELIKRIVDPALKPPSKDMPLGSVNMIPKAGQLFKAINTIIITILNKTDRTTIYVALMQLLETSMAEGVMNPPQTDGDISRMDFGEMTMKCLWRLTKDLPRELHTQFDFALHSPHTTTTPGTSLQQIPIVSEEISNPMFGNPSHHPSLRIEPLIQMSHRFFVHVPDREWRKREDRNKWVFGDLPKRTIKSINHALVSVFKESIWQFTGLIIRDIVSENPGLIRSPPASPSSHMLESGANGNNSAQDIDPSLLRWVDDVHSKMMRMSETWSYFSSAISQNDQKASKPTVTQLKMAFVVAQNSLNRSGEYRRMGDGVWGDISDDEVDTRSSASTILAGFNNMNPRSASSVGSAASPVRSPSILAHMHIPPSIASTGGMSRGSPRFSTNMDYAAPDNGGLNHGYQSPSMQQGHGSGHHQHYNNEKGGDSNPVLQTTDAMERLNSIKDRFRSHQISANSSSSSIASSNVQSQRPQVPVSSGGPTTQALSPRLANNPEVSMNDIKARLAAMRNSLRKN